LDGVAAAVPLWRRAFAAHPTEPDIAREAGLALLRSDLAAEALAVNRAIVAVRPDDASLWCNLAVCELLNGDLAQAEAALARSRQLDPADPIAAAVVTRLARSRAGAPLPRTLAEMERGG
jgi:Flp pilus assembly protein TadD